jgi:signal transduction histidine kinase/DNA-binding NarL/FixJ family response regulator
MKSLLFKTIAFCFFLFVIASFSTGQLLLDRVVSSTEKSVRASNLRSAREVVRLIRTDVLTQNYSVAVTTVEELNRELPFSFFDIENKDKSLLSRRLLNSGTPPVPLSTVELWDGVRVSSTSDNDVEFFELPIYFSDAQKGELAAKVKLAFRNDSALQLAKNIRELVLIYVVLVAFLVSTIFAAIYFITINKFSMYVESLRMWIHAEDDTMPFPGDLAFVSDRIQFFKNEILTKQKRIETLSVSEAIASTTSALAHDVRKPFSMLKMVLNSILTANSPQEAQDIAKTSLPEIAQSLVTVDGMIQDVMQIGSNSAPNQEIATPDTIVESALNEVFRIFPDANVTIEYDLQHKHSIFVDTLRVGRVFSNIMVNALQAMDAKGVIWIKTSEQNGFVEFKLGNVGSCIPVASLPKLFEAFFTSDKKGGTGLGLAIAQKVVKEHGGEIRCESQRTTSYPDGYVEFIFTLPLANEACAPRTADLPKTASAVHAQFASLKAKIPEASNAEELILEQQLIEKIAKLGKILVPILIVDDEAVYRNSLANLLLKGNTEISQIPLVFAKNYAEALSTCETHKPFLVIQDIDLGVSSKNGIETILELRKQNFAGRICVHSNRFLFGDQREAFEAGADSVLPKPMSRAHLLKLILTAVEDTSQFTSHENAQKKPAADADPSKRIRLAFLDDAKTFTMIWKMKLKSQMDIETFSKTTDFLTAVESDPAFLQSFDIIVTDFHFADGDPHTGKTLATKIRQLGFTKPIMLASNGDFNAEELKPDLNGCVGKDVPSLSEIENWLKSSI